MSLPTRLNRNIGALSLLVALAAVAGGAQAHEVRFVASYGDNANLCTRDAPCKTMQQGVNLTPTGGELIVLDSGDYGNDVTIGESITISAIGVSATLGGTITIDNATATVVLRGLRLNGAGAASTGINILAAAAVHIDDCEIQSFGGIGIQAEQAVDVRLFVSGSVSRNNGIDGLRFNAPTGSGGTLVVDNSRFENNLASGLDISDIDATITRTIVSSNFTGIFQKRGTANVTWTTTEHNLTYGYLAVLSEPGVMMTLERSVVRGNAVAGLHFSSGGTAVISDSVVTNNGTGLSVQAGATLLTRRNNIVSGNTTDVSGIVISLGGI